MNATQRNASDPAKIENYAKPVALLGKRKRPIGWLFVACLIPFFVLLVFAGWFGWKELQTSRLLQSELQELASQGRPTDNPSMQRWFDSTTHKEGTEAWLEILKLASSGSQLGPDLPFVGDAYLPSDITAGMEWPSEPRVAEYLELHEPLFQQITEAGRFPKPIWLPIEWKGTDTLLPDLQDSRNIVRLLELKALHSLWKKDTQEALDALKSIKETAEAFDSHLCLVAELVCVAERGSLYHMLNRSLGMDVWSEDELGQLEELVKEAYPYSKEGFAKSWETTFAGERVMALTWLQSIPSEALLRYLIFPSDTRRILEYYQGLIDIGQGGMDGLLERSKRQTAVFVSEMRGFPTASRFILGAVAPSIEAYSQALERHHITRQVTLTSIAIKRFQQKHGKFPETLSQLGSPDWPIPDWNINGRKAFVYQVTDQVVNLYYPASESPHSVLETLPIESSQSRKHRLEIGYEVVIR